MSVQKMISWWRNTQAVHQLLGLLITFTATMLIWHHFGMNLYLRLDPQHFHKVKASGDQEYQHGNSASRLTTTPDYWQLDCQLNPGYRNPFCSLDMDLSHGDQGVDLSDFNVLLTSFNREFSEINQKALNCVFSLLMVPNRGSL